MHLSKNSQVSIVLPGAATAREQFAAEELAKYLKAMFSGICVSLTEDSCPGEGNQILLADRSVTAGLLNTSQRPSLITKSPARMVC